MDWCGVRDLNGRDPKTGKVVRTLSQEMAGPMSHDRCYRNRITHRYYLNSASGGSDFVKLDGTAETPNPWARPTCGLAVMPANGMLYNGPSVCQCAIGTMATGVNGFYNGCGNTDRRFNVSIEPRLVKGPAFGTVEGPAASAEQTNASYAGRNGGIAWLLDAADGRPLQELRFDAAPVWDGVAIAHNSLFVCLKDGSVVCLSAK
ncbi:hypothetical protein NZK35_10125 [Stieleria sp. ICT_E10.1]|uniref:hypothetical protein n=1 Tax=Stieleria sedimenti TaxID=2976331 RepID=UPI002180625D|nr:hypothetical protein [Stieleria sedimenti]MCS7467002.1 hypothetical protein [Stieleria sedimenti]